MGTSFLRAAAHDDDQGTNAAITYSLTHQTPAYFRINPSTGWVYVNHPISQVRCASYIPQSAFRIIEFLRCDLVPYLDVFLSEPTKKKTLKVKVALDCRVTQLTFPTASSVQDNGTPPNLNWLNTERLISLFRLTD